MPRVLILYPYDERLPATSIGGEIARTRLIEATHGKIELFSEFLDQSRFRDEGHIANMARYLAGKYAPVRPDVVMALGPESISFIVKYRDTIAPEARIVYTGISGSEASRLHLPDGVFGAVSEFDIRKTIAMARGLQPDARRLVVVVGSSPFDKEWLDAAKRDIAKLEQPYETIYLTDLTVDEFVKRVSELPRDTILLILTVFKDSSGRNLPSRDVAGQLAKAATAPSYGPYSTYVGEGIVGTSTSTFEAMGSAVADLALAALANKPMADVIVPQTYLADARELKRWGLLESKLPPGTVLSFEEKSVWQEHHVAILLTFAIVAVQALAIGALLMERRRRATAERVARSRLLEVVHLNQSATAGALSASIAHELNQPLGAIRNNTRAAELVLKSANPDLGLMRQILADIRDDDQRASDIIAGLRSMLKKRGEIEWQELDVNEVVANALQILHGEAERRQVEIDFLRPSGQLPVRADRVHLQQVILNIATNAMDAMLGVAERKLMLKTGLVDAGQVDVSIADTGTGIPNEKLTRIFETFYTTKAGGTGLGLTISRTVVESYGGRIWAENRPEGGAIVRVILPMAQTS
ncbi:ATP-binding protein [Mesorhizobium sp. BAC0120]|nr:ATP-binding protein [Mesorhizobium sp. BAC0120]MDW6024255.1 ATP-binding protein [Mesorhizobium sp. BAC0120]